MYALGIHYENEKVLIALLQKVKNKIEVIQTQVVGRDVKLLDMLAPILEGKKVKIATGLPADAIVRRDAVLKLKGERKVLQALPFQVETLIPFPMNEAVILPRLYPDKDGSTHVVLFATQKKHLQEHLASLDFEPDVVSFVPAALMRFCQFSRPDIATAAMIYGNSGICVEQGKLAFSQVLDPERLKAYIEQKFPDTAFVPADEYAVPIGLALDALNSNPMQLRVEEFTSPKEKRRESLFFKSFAAACAALCLGIFGINAFLTGQKEKELHAAVDAFCKKSSEGLERRVHDWEGALSTIRKPSSSTPKVSDILAWLSSKKDEIDIFHLRYTAYPARVELEFTAPSPTIARALHEELLKGDPMVDPKGDIEWQVSADSYRIAFSLRKQR